MKVDFRRLTWENYPSTETPINADNLNRLEEGVAGLYSDVAEIEQELGGGVGEYVTGWLNEHVDPVGSAVVVDDALTIEGAAADAKKTGDEISSLKEDLKSLTGQLEDAVDFQTIEESVALSGYLTQTFYNIETDVAVRASLLNSGWVTFDPYPVTAGEKYQVQACQGNTEKTRIWVVTDDNLNIIAKAENHKGTNYATEEFTVPQGGTKLLVTSTSSVSGGSLPYAFVKKYITTSIKDDVADLKTRTDALQESVDSNLMVIVSASKSYSDLSSAGNTGYIKTNGDIQTYTNGYVSDYIEVIPESAIEYLIAYIYGPAVAIAFYNANHVFVSGITAQSGTSGNYVKAEGTSNIPATAQYMRVFMSKNTEAQVPKQNQYVAYSAKNQIGDTVRTLVAEVGSPWAGKKWCAFGTSITDTGYINQETGEVTGKYVPFLKNLSGLNVTNRGIAGGTLGSNGIHGGSSNILNAILNSNDLDNFDLITIEGFVNDFACAITIGDIGDTQNTTFYGALHQAISYCLEHSHAEVVLITESTGKQYTLSGGTTADYRILHKNSLDLYQQAYNDAMIRIGQYYGVHVIDAGGKSQINQYHPEYIIDQIHHTTLGGEQYAKTIWEELKNIRPAEVASS